MATAAREAKLKRIKSTRIARITGKAVNVLCTQCKKYKTENKCNHTKVWSETSCVTCKDSIRQLKSDAHVKAVKLENVCQIADRNRGIEQAFQAQVSL